MTRSQHRSYVTEPVEELGLRSGTLRRTKTTKRLNKSRGDVSKRLIGQCWVTAHPENSTETVLLKENVQLGLHLFFYVVNCVVLKQFCALSKQVVLHAVTIYHDAV